MGTAFDDAAVFHDQDLIGVADGAQAVGDDEAGAPVHQGGEGALDAGLGDRIDRAGGFVEHEDAWVGEHGADEADELALAQREAGAAFADHGLQLVGQGLEQVQAVQPAGRFDDLGVGGFRAAEADVVHDRAGKQEVLLLDDPHLPMQRRRFDAAEFAAIDADLSRAGEVELRQQVDDRGLAAAGVADQGDGLARLGDDVDLVQDAALGGVAEADLVELDPAVEAGQVLGGGVVPPFRRGIEDAEDAFGAGHGREGLVIEVADAAHGLEEDAGEEEEVDQVADRHVDPRGEHAVAAHQQQHGDEHLAGELQQRQEDGRGACHLDVVLRMGGHHVLENAGVDVLAHEALGHPDAVDRLGQGGGQATEALLVGAHDPAETLAEQPVDQPHHRRQHQDDEEQHPVAIEHEQRRDDHLAAQHQADEHHILDPGTDRLDVGRDPADDTAQFLAVEEAHRHGEQVGTECRAQVVDHGFAQAHGQEVAEVQGELGQRRQGGEAGRAEQCSMQVAAADRAGDDRAEDPGQAGQLDGADDDQAEEDVPPAGIRPGVGEQAADQARIEGALLDLDVVIALELGQGQARFGAHGRPPAARAETPGGAASRRRVSSSVSWWAMIQR